MTIKMQNPTILSICILSLTLGACNHTTPKLSGDGYKPVASLSEERPLNEKRFNNQATLISANLLMDLNSEDQIVDPLKTEEKIAPDPASKIENAPKIQTVAKLPKVVEEPITRSGPLRAVLSILVPDSISITYHDDLDNGVEVEYLEGKQWVKNLSQIGKDHLIDFDIVENTLYVSKSAVTFTESSPRIFEGSPEVVIRGKPVNNDLVKGDVKFLVKRKQNVRSTLEKWVEASDGWTVIYNATQSYPIQADYEFDGPFKNAAKELLTAFSKADPPLAHTIYNGNKVIVVRDGNAYKKGQ